MLKEKLKKHNIILCSSSPRRKELLLKLGLNFTTYNTTQKEKYPYNININNVAEFLAKQKGKEFIKKIKNNDLIITADTIVILKGEILNKPKDKKEAVGMLNKLSGETHKVITGVCIKTKKEEITFSETTLVTFKKLTTQEINYYISKYKPFDKAGSYGIQEWIGDIGVKKIYGSYSNVMGIPLNRIYEKLKKMI